jgi:hypothetical protein
MTKATDNSTPSISRRDAVNLIVGGAAGATGLGGSVVCAAADPMFAAIESHRSMTETMNASAVNASDEEVDRLGEVCDDGWARILDTAPTTTAGLLAFMQYVRMEGHEYGYVNLHEEDDAGMLKAWQTLERMIRLGHLRVAPT